MNTRRRWLQAAGTLAGAVLGHAWAQPTNPAPSASSALDAPLLLVNAVYPPLVNPVGHGSGEGIDIDIAREALRRGGYTGPVELQWVPWKRALFMLEHGQADFTTTVNHSADRERFLRFSTSYRAGKRYHFYTRRGAGLKLEKLADLQGLRLALSAGYLYPQAVLDMAAGQLEHARDVGAAVQLVEQHRADVVLVTALVGAWEIRQLGLADRLERQPLQHFNPEPTYMAFAKASPRAAAAQAAMDAGLAAMLRDGSITRIERRYVR